jgi:hypothetical protein
MDENEPSPATRSSVGAQHGDEGTDPGSGRHHDDVTIRGHTRECHRSLGTIGEPQSCLCVQLPEPGRERRLIDSGHKELEPVARPSSRRNRVGAAHQITRHDKPDLDVLSGREGGHLPAVGAHPHDAQPVGDVAPVDECGVVRDLFHGSPCSRIPSSNPCWTWIGTS